MGWYSKEDMRTDLKWNTNLESLAVDDCFCNSLFSEMATLPFYHKLPMLRKKIEGAILVCMQDEKHLVRLGS